MTHYRPSALPPQSGAITEPNLAGRDPFLLVARDAWERVGRTAGVGEVGLGQQGTNGVVRVGMRDAAGIAGIYERVEESFWNAIESGKTPGLKVVE